LFTGFVDCWFLVEEVINRDVAVLSIYMLVCMTGRLRRSSAKYLHAGLGDGTIET